MSYQPLDPDKMNLTALNQRMDKVKTKIFLGKMSAFYGSLLCSLDFIWSRELPTAATDGLRMWWNPDWFEQLSIDTAGTVLRHELDHVARMHNVRRGDRDPKLWNWACDYRINNDLENDGFTFKGTQPLIDHTYDKDGELLSEEDIYNLLQSKQITIPGSWGDDDGDIVEGTLTAEDKARAVSVVVAAAHNAKASGEPIPGDVKKVMDQFLNPVIPWEIVLRQFFVDQMDQGNYTMRRPNRRHHDVYLPSLEDEDEGRLECLLYFQDVSGSITDADSQRFNSELKYVWEELRPKKVIIAQFDTRISKVDVFKEEDRFDWIETVGGGGTCLEPVREMILKEKPQAAVIFSDLECAQMDCSEIDCPLIWATIRNRTAKVQKGKIIHIR